MVPEIPGQTVLERAHLDTVTMPNSPIWEHHQTAPPHIDVLDPCAGPGGWSVAAAMLGFREVGIELDPSACATRAAAGHLTVRADVSLISTKRLRRLAGRIRGLIFSPPCGTFSAAGKGEGIGDLPLLHRALDDLAAGTDPRAELTAACTDPRTPLVVEPLRYALAIRPEWIALEQVPAVLPLWQHIARILRGIGYSAWCGILNAADYGVPQTRRRAILIASRVRKVAPPEPTHAKVAESETLFGPGRRQWVSMAEALGWLPAGVVNTRGDRKTPGGNEFPTVRPSWALTEKTRSWVLHTNRDQRPDGTRQTADPYAAPAPSLTGKSGGQWVLKHNDRANATIRSADEPAATLAFGHAGTEYEWVLRNNTQARGASRSLDEPAGTLFFGEKGNDVSRVAERPATTVAATGRIAKPGHRDREGGERQFEESVRITVEEAAVLQSFPADYPWQGTKTKKFLQIGNAVPPLLALHIISAASGSGAAR